MMCGYIGIIYTFMVVFMPLIYCTLTGFETIVPEQVKRNELPVYEPEFKSLAP